MSEPTIEELVATLHDLLHQRHLASYDLERTQRLLADIEAKIVNVETELSRWHIVRKIHAPRP